MNPDLSRLLPYPFERLAALKATVTELVGKYSPNQAGLS